MPTTPIHTQDTHPIPGTPSPYPRTLTCAWDTHPIPRTPTPCLGHSPYPEIPSPYPGHPPCAQYTHPIFQDTHPCLRHPPGRCPRASFPQLSDPSRPTDIWPQHTSCSNHLVAFTPPACHPRGRGCRHSSQGPTQPQTLSKFKKNLLNEHGACYGCGWGGKQRKWSR